MPSVGDALRGDVKLEWAFLRWIPLQIGFQGKRAAGEGASV